MSDILQLAADNQKKARELIKESGVIEVWKAIGAQINLVGSLKMGLLMKHLDIDFHIYTPELNIIESFNVIAKFAENPAVSRIEYRNLIETPESCIEWHAWYCDNKGTEWKFDMIQILKGSYYDGYFERIAERIQAVLTPESKLAILELKNAAPSSENIMGIEYYQAVIADGIRTWDEFIRWRHANPVNGIIEWCP